MTGNVEGGAKSWEKKYSFFTGFTATILVGIAGAFISIAMPGILLAISQNAEFPADRAAMFASTELCGMLASILFIGKLLNSKYRKTILVFAMAAIIVGNFASVFVYKSNVLLLARLLAGIGEGVAVAALGAAAASFSNPDRLFALFMSTNMGLVTAYLFFLPRIIAASGIESAFLVLVGLGVVGLLALPYFPSAIERKSATLPSVAKVRAGGLSAGAILGLAGCLGLNTGVGMVWPFMGALGSARGISSEAISTDLAMATFGGIAAGFSAALLGLRCGRRLPLIIGTLALVSSSIGLVSDTANFSLCVILFLFSWVFVTSYFMGTVAAVKDGDRAAVFIPAAQLGGLALGPQLSALVIDNFSLSWMVAGGSAICTMSALFALIGNSSRQKQLAA